jgi:hypothetical protein
MTVSIKDRVKQSTTTTGTGTITLSSTPSGYQSFSSVFSNGDTVYYVIENGSMYEIGVGTYSAGTLSRDTVLKSSSGTSLITLSGRSTVFVAVPADKTIYINDTNKASIGLGNLSNVSLTSPASGDIVTYNGSTWSNGNFTEQIQDAVAASFVAGTGIDISYNDGLNTISVSSSGLLQAALNGLGTAALSNSGDFYLSTNPSGYISASSVAAGYQPLDGDLTSLSSVTGVDTIYYRSATSTWSPVVIGTGILFSGGTLSNTLDLSSYATSTGVATLYTPLSRTITINGSGQDLTSDRSWTVGDLRSDSSYSDPTWLTSLAWSKISGTPTTISGYGITNAYTKTEVDSLVTGLLDFKGNLDCSANPSYPAGSKGDAYYVSVAGKIGDASGKSVEVGDLIVASVDNAGGTEASVGTSWFVLEHNLNGALVASNNLSDLTSASTARGNLGLGSLATITPTGTIDLSAYLTTSSAAATYVPYTGATGAVNLGSQSLTAGAIVGTSTIGDSTSVGGMNGFDFSSTAGTVLIRQGGTRWIGFKSIGTVFSNAGGIGFAANGSSTSFTTSLYEDSTGILALRNSTNAQTFNIANTYTGSTNYEYGTLKWTSNEFRVGTSVGSAGGNQRSIVIGTWNSVGTWTPAVTVATTGATTFANTIYASSYYGLVMGGDVYFARDVASTLELRNSTTAIDFRISGTYTSSTSNEFIRLRGVAASNFEFGPSNGSAGGTLRGLTIGGYTNGSSTITPWLTFDNAGAAVFSGNTVSLINGTTAQTLNIANTYTSSTNFEYGRLSWTSNQFRIGSAVYGTGQTGGSNRDTVMGIWDTSSFFKGVLTIGANGGSPIFALTPYSYNGFTYTAYSNLSTSVMPAGTVEAVEVKFDLTNTKNFNTGALTTQRSFLIMAPVYACASAKTITTASTVSITGAPTASGSLTITNAYALNIENGRIYSGYAGVDSIVLGPSTCGIQFNNGNTAIVQTASNYLQFRIGGATRAVWDTGFAQDYSFGGGFRWYVSYGGTEWGFYATAGTAHTTSLVSGTNAQTLNIGNTYTSTTNFEYGRFQWNSNEFRIGTAVGSAGGTQRNLILGAWDSTGTFSPKVVIQPTSTGAIYFESATAGTTRGQYAIDLQLYRSASSQIASDYGVAIGTQCTVSGGAGSVAIGRSVSVTDSLGGSVGIGRNITLTGYRAVGIGNGITASSDSVAIGTASYAAHASAICLMGSKSRWAGQIIWEGSSSAEGVFGASYNLPYIGTHAGGQEQATIAVRTTSNTLTTLQSIAVGTGYTTSNRQKHKSVLYHGDFVITAMRSDGACAKFARRVLVKSLADAAGSTYTFSVLQSETIGTDINEISGSAISFATTASTQTVDIQVQGESSYACTGVSATNIITAVGHPYANDDIIVFLTLTGGSSLQTNPSGFYYQSTYKVINVSGDTFQLATPGSSTTPLALGSDISAGTVSRPIIWTKVSGKFAVVTSGY